MLTSEMIYDEVLNRADAVAVQGTLGLLGLIRLVDGYEAEANLANACAEIATEISTEGFYDAATLAPFTQSAKISAKDAKYRHNVASFVLNEARHNPAVPNDTPEAIEKLESSQAEDQETKFAGKIKNEMLRSFLNARNQAYEDEDFTGIDARYQQVLEATLEKYKTKAESLKGLTIMAAIDTQRAITNGSTSDYEHAKKIQDSVAVQHSLYGTYYQAVQKAFDEISRGEY